MRSLAISFLALALASNLQAQHQEPSLLDRLLRPNMELQNNVQNKKFATPAAAVERGGTVGTFYLQANRFPKSFFAGHNYSTGGYAARAFNSGSRTVASTQDYNANTSASVGTSAIHDVRVRAAHDAQQRVATRDYDEQRQFTEPGKSQKSLERQNPPLTIDQVRELLNKNK